MKKRGLQLIISLSLLLLAGCSENKPSPKKKEGINSNPGTNFNYKKESNTNPFHHQLIESRFVAEPYPIQSIKTEIKTGSDDDFQYYRPVDKIEKLNVIPLKGLPKISRQSKEDEYYNRKSAFYREPALYIPGRTSQEAYFSAVFDNDIFDYTDYYYTNGICLELFHPAISAFPIARILPGLKNSLNYYGLTVVQNMYTPRKLEELSVRIGDRPFAAYLTVGHQRISLSADRHRRLQSEFVLGVIGPASLGNVAQDLIHSNTPVGWVNQVKNDFVVNYGLRFDQGVYSGNGIEIAVFGGGQAGTLYDNLMAGLFLQIGKFNDRYESIFQTTGHQETFKHRIRYYFALDVKNKLVIYDATMQGGMFNTESVYTFNGSQVNHYVFTGTVSVGLGLGRYSLEAEQVFLTPEFDGGRKHLWFRIKNIIHIN
jgi:lipid A 3-O-deacylase